MIFLGDNHRIIYVLLTQVLQILNGKKCLFGLTTIDMLSKNILVSE